MEGEKVRPVYMVVWMDAIVFKLRNEGKVTDKAVQITIGLNNRGYKEVLGMWVCQNESAAFWMGIKFVVWKDKKQAAIDFRLIYNAPDAELGQIELKHFDEKWPINALILSNPGVQTAYTYPLFLSPRRHLKNYLDQPD